MRRSPRNPIPSSSISPPSKLLCVYHRLFPPRSPPSLALSTPTLLSFSHSPRRAARWLLSPSSRHSLLHHAFFYSFFFPLYDYVNQVRQEVDNVIRKRVFVGNYSVPPNTIATSALQETVMIALDTMVKLPPFSAMGVSIDVRGGIGTDA